MDYFFRLMHPWVFGIALIVIGVCACIRWFYYRFAYVRYSMATLAKKQQLAAPNLYKTVPFALRLLVLILIALLAARPQIVHNNSIINAEGIDIMMVLDASGSMQCFDDMQDRRTRFQVAKQEGIRFIEKRTHDQIGLVLFGKDAISRCPLTLDKKMLSELIDTMQLGVIDPDGTVLSIAMCMAARRLQHSKAKTKIMIVLTDGEPTAQLDLSPDIAIDLAKKLGIKIYTIGIGGEHGGLWQDPLFGVRQMGFRLNKDLLQSIATQTGGKFFLAQKADDVNAIYATIDALEKTEYQAPIFTYYQELVIPFVISALLILLLELILTTFVWFRI